MAMTHENIRVGSHGAMSSQPWGGGLVASTGAAVLTAEPVAAENWFATIDGDNTGYEWPGYAEKDLYWTSSTDILHRTDANLKMIGAGERDGGDKWGGGFRLAGYHGTREHGKNEDPQYGSKISNITSHYTGIKDIGSHNSEELFWGTDPSNIGGWPGPEETVLEYSVDVFQAFVDVALSTASSTYSGVKDAAYLYDVMADYESKYSYADPNEEIEYEWAYGSGIGADTRSDAHDYMEFKFNMDWGDTADIDAWSRFMDAEHYKNPEIEVRYKITLDSPSNTSSVSTSSTGDGNSTVENWPAEKKKEWGMKRITPANLRRLGFDPANYAKDSEGLIWWSTTPKASVEINTDVQTK